jgi:phage gp16-like protein
VVTDEKNTKLRKALYAKVAIARKQLPEMDNDDFFREFLAERFNGKRSQRDLSSVELIRLVDVLARFGAVYTDKKSNKRRERPYVRADFIEIPADDPNASVKRMICAIWRKLGYAMTGLETRMERQTGILSILGLHDRKKLSAILTDLRKREKAYVKRTAAASECGA